MDLAENSQNTYLGRNASGMHMKPRRAPALNTGGCRRACLTPTKRGWVGAEAFPPDWKDNGTETRQGPDFRSHPHWTDSGEPDWSSGWCKTDTRTRSLPHCAHHCVTRAAVRRHDGRERSCHHASQANESPRARQHGRHHARERTHAIADDGGGRRRGDHAHGRHREYPVSGLHRVCPHAYLRPAYHHVHHARHGREQIHGVADYGDGRRRADHARGRHRAWGGQHVGDHLSTRDWPRLAHSCSVTSMPLLRN